MIFKNNKFYKENHSCETFYHFCFKYPLGDEAFRSNNKRLK